MRRGVIEEEKVLLQKEKREGERFPTSALLTSELQKLSQASLKVCNWKQAVTLTIINESSNRRFKVITYPYVERLI